jgi:hypothetical protein
MQLSDFLTYVKYDFKRTDKDTELTQAYNDTINSISLLMPHGNYKYQSWIYTIIGQEDYPLPSNMIHLIHPIRLLDGTGSNDSGYPLEKLTKDEYDEVEPNPNRTNPSTGKPWGYTVFSRSILLTNIPDKATYLLEINWSKRVVAQAATTDQSLLGAEWDEILKWGTLFRVFAGMERFDEANYWRSMYEDSEGNPIGMLRRLLDIEKEIEGRAVGQVKFNAL